MTYPDDTTGGELDELRRAVMGDEERSVLDRAVEYARFGLRVFPVRHAPGEAGDKAPLPGYGWKVGASSKINEVVEDFTYAIDLWGDDHVHVAWALGLDGHVAIDMDVPQADWPSWVADVIGSAAINVTARGQHLIFKNPPDFEPGNETSRFPSEGWGEVRGAGGYIIIAGPDRPGLDVDDLDLAQPFPRPDWLAPYGGGAEAVSRADVVEFARQHTLAGSPAKLKGLRTMLSRKTASLRPGDPVHGRHPFLVYAACLIAEEASAGHYPFSEASKLLRDWWVSVTEPHRHGREFENAIAWGIGRAKSSGATTVAGTGAPDDPNHEESLMSSGDEADTITVRGGSFVFDEDTDMVARWGQRNEIAWAAGEALMICGTPGVGKTTLAQQLVGGLCGLWGDVLDMPIMPARRVLYLAMDRPRQIARSMRRLFSDVHRSTLDERLLVRKGPLPVDLATDPTQLLELATQHGCDVIVVDSLKDACTRLTEDEPGGQVNRAIQYCNANGVDVLVLHHQRKGRDGEPPKKLEDVYGSTWLTAGMGSVLLLWGEAGADQVELFHLKQPADPIEKLKVEHDHVRGVSRVVSGQFDMLWYVNRHGAAKGVTTSQVAQAKHGRPIPSHDKRHRQVRRQLDSLAAQGLIEGRGQTRPGAEATWHPVAGGPEIDHEEQQDDD